MVVEQCYLVEELGGFGELSIAEERSQKLEQVNQQLMKEGPPLHTERRERTVYAPECPLFYNTPQKLWTDRWSMRIFDKFQMYRYEWRVQHLLLWCLEEKFGDEDAM